MRTEKKSFFLISAPDIPAAELDALQKHVEEADADPDYTVVTNYAVLIDKVELENNELLVVSAPTIPDEFADTEILALEEKIRKAMNGELKFVVVNYDVRIEGIVRNANHTLVGTIYEGSVTDTVKFREKLGDYATDPKNNLIVMNRYLQVFQVPFSE